MTTYGPPVEPYDVDITDPFAVGRVIASAHHGDVRAQLTMRKIQPALNAQRDTQNAARRQTKADEVQARRDRLANGTNRGAVTAVRDAYIKAHSKPSTNDDPKGNTHA